MQFTIARAVLAVLVLLSGFTQPAWAKEGVVEINGVVQSMPASGLIGAWVIAGRNVRTDAATVIKQEQGAIGVGALVESKGVDEGNGVTLATIIEVKQGASAPPAGAPSDDFTGAIESLPSGTLIGRWTVAGRKVDVLTTTVLKQQLGGFAVGAIVEVHGTVDAGGVVAASVIEVKSGGTTAPVPVASVLEIVGPVESLPATGTIGTWRVAGRSVIVTATTVLDNEHGAFAVGVTVEVKGASDTSGALVATRIERVAGNGAPVAALKFWGTIESLPSSAGFIGVWKVSGRVVNVGASTALRVNNGPIAIGAIVEVDGWAQADGAIEAQEIETRTSIGSLPGQGPLAVEYSNAALGHYFVTAFSDEIAFLDGGAFAGAWKRTGETFKTGGAAAVCRFYGMPPKGPDSHFFTVDAAECEHVVTTWQAWTYEAHAFATTPPIAGACPAGLVAVRRFYNNPAVRRRHESPLCHERGGGQRHARQGLDRGGRRDVRAAVARQPGSFAPFGHRSHIRPSCRMRPASRPACVPNPQKKSARTGPRIAPPVSCASVSRVSGVVDSGIVVARYTGAPSGTKRGSTAMVRSASERYAERALRSVDGRFERSRGAAAAPRERTRSSDSRRAARASRPDAPSPSC